MSLGTLTHLLLFVDRCTSLRRWCTSVQRMPRVLLHPVELPAFKHPEFGVWPCFKGALRALCEKLSVLDPFSLAKVTAVTTALLHTGLLQILTQSKTSENELQQFMFQTDNARLLSGWIWESSLTIGCCAHSVQKRPKIWPRCIQLLSWVRGASVRCAGTVQKVGYFLEGHCGSG